MYLRSKDLVKSTGIVSFGAGPALQVTVKGYWGPRRAAPAHAGGRLWGGLTEHLLRSVKCGRIVAVPPSPNFGEGSDGGRI